MNEQQLLEHIVVNPQILLGETDHSRMAVEHIPGMLAAGETTETILREYSFLEPADIRVCLLFARR